MTSASPNRPNEPWSLEQARSTYAIRRWGEGYFDINEEGHVCVAPDSTRPQQRLDLYRIARAVKQEGLSLPVLVRFTDILRDRVRSLQNAFDAAREENHYTGRYTAVYPIKVNQQRKVIESILDDGREGVGLEAGSKPELLAILALSSRGIVICNGYKDRAYIRLALIGIRLGLDVFIVIEKPAELSLILEEAENIGVIPQLGVRIRLSSIGAGNWQNSGGEKSKFGLNASEVLRLVERLKQAGRLEALQLMHFHMGSQVANIRDIKEALREAGRHYAELHKLGANIRCVDVGGGLGVDYEGARSRSFCSMNYNMAEYAQNIVRAFGEICARHGLAHPDLVTESGRAMTAHHAVLITHVVDMETTLEETPACFSSSQFHDPDHAFASRPVLEVYHDAQFDLAETRAMYLQGKLGLAELAEAECFYAAICQEVRRRLDAGNRAHRDVLDELNENLADKVFCNFSLFQSMPDVWGIDQIFPVMPLHRLGEEPTRRGVIQDLTCDSDGRIDAYIDRQNIEKTLPLHAPRPGEPYLIGFFLLGAYQEILGDMHNLFGDTHSVNIEMDERGGYRFIQPLEGDDVGDLLRYVHIDPEQLKQAFRKKLAATDLAPELRRQFEHELNSGLTAYTYLEK